MTNKNVDFLYRFNIEICHFKIYKKEILQFAIENGYENTEETDFKNIKKFLEEIKTS